MSDAILNAVIEAEVFEAEVEAEVIYDTDVSVDEVGIEGPPGPAGKGWLFGTGGPTDSLGRNGDLYLDLTTYVAYGPKVGSTWAGVSQMDLRQEANKAEAANAAAALAATQAALSGVEAAQSASTAGAAALASSEAAGLSEGYAAGAAGSAGTASSAAGNAVAAAGAANDNADAAAGFASDANQHRIAAGNSAGSAAGSASAAEGHADSADASASAAAGSAGSAVDSATAAGQSAANAGQSATAAAGSASAAGASAGAASQSEIDAAEHAAAALAAAVQAATFDPTAHYTKSASDARYATTDQGNKADSALQPSSIGTTAGKLVALDSGGMLPANLLPAIAITDVFEVGGQAAMLALSAQRGDVAIRTDLNKTFVLATDAPSTLANWKELRTPTDVVMAVAGLTGTITAAALKTALAITVADISNASANGRSLISAANYAAMFNLLKQQATDTVSGVAEIATSAEVLAFLDITRIVTPAALGSVRGAANGLAGLGADGKVPSAQLPSSGGGDLVRLGDRVTIGTAVAAIDIAIPDGYDRVVVRLLDLCRVAGGASNESLLARLSANGSTFPSANGSYDYVFDQTTAGGTSTGKIDLTYGNTSYYFHEAAFVFAELLFVKPKSANRNNGFSLFTSYQGNGRPGFFLGAGVFKTVGAIHTLRIQTAMGANIAAGAQYEILVGNPTS